MRLEVTERRVQLSEGLAEFLEGYKKRGNNELAEIFVSLLGNGCEMRELPLTPGNCVTEVLGVSLLRGAVFSMFRLYVGREIPEMEGGCIVGYFNRKGVSCLFKHVGNVLDDGRVKSKWGNEGPVVVHDIEDVPSIYGNEVRFYERLRGSRKKIRI